jgi:uncharacterized protein (TIGR02271 family)
MTTTLVALYDDIATARRVVNDLVNHGFDRNDISLIARDANDEYRNYVSDDYDDTSTEAAEGAGIGAVVGGIGGLLVGLGALAIPGVGPVIAAGPIVGALTGAGVGAIAGGIIGALVDMGLPEEEAHYYAEGLRRGGILVAAQVPDTRVEEAVDIMEHYNPVDVDERAGYWRESGWNRFEGDTEPMTRRDIDQDYQRYGVDRSTTRDYPPYTGRTTTDRDTRRTRDTGDEATFDVVEEDVQIGKRQVERGGIRVRRHIVEKPIEQQVTLSETHVNVERQPVDRPASDADFNNMRDQTFEVTETAEEAVVRKQPRVTEEVRVTKDRQQHTETIRDTARRTEVDVERTGREGNGRKQTDWNQFEPEFRRHYETNFRDTNYPYDRYERAYRYGHQLGADDRYRNADWQTVETTARRDWESRYGNDRDNAWDNFKDAVRHGWERTKAAVR